MSERLMLWRVALPGWAREVREESGQAAVEYGVLLALILLGALVFIPGVGTAVANCFSDASAAI